MVPPLQYSANLCSQPPVEALTVSRSSLLRYGSVLSAILEVVGSGSAVVAVVASDIVTLSVVCRWCWLHGLCWPRKRLPRTLL
jgi:hypothetical protein